MSPDLQPSHDNNAAPDEQTSRRDVPVHPIPSMQQAFAESLIEATAGQSSVCEKPALRTGDAKARRELLLDQDKSDGAPGALWRFRPGQQCHELRKLIAQVSFGVYLLLNGLANSNIQVVSILQGHIDEVDEFLEVAMEDINLAAQDLTERIDYLKLPMDNMTVFKTMLEDRAFRLQIIEGNAKIEHILSRTTTALVQSAQDISEGLRSTREFSQYLAEQARGPWRVERPDVVDIFDAMRGNTEGWLNAFKDLQSHISTLNALIAKLSSMVALIERTAGIVSRETRFSIQPFTRPDECRLSEEDSIQSSTPPASPSTRVPSAPPRLSLRFSRLPEDRPSGPTYFDLPLGDSSRPASKSSVDRPDRHHYRSESQSTSASLRPPSQMEAEVVTRLEPEPEPELEPEPEPELEHESLSISGGTTGRQQQPAERPPSRPDSPTEGGCLYLLQPRTYTPIPPAPLPSPRIVDESRLGGEIPPPVPEMSRDRRFSSSGHRGEGKIGGDGSARGISGNGSDAGAISAFDTNNNDDSDGDDDFDDDVDDEFIAAVVAPASEARQGSKIIRVSSPRILVESPPPKNLSPSVEQQQQQQQEKRQQHSPRRDEEADETRRPKRTSLRQRISLKTNPPDSIQVPPRNAPELQRPVFASPRTYQGYQTFVGPDSAYGSDNDRTAVNSMAETRSGRPSVGHQGPISSTDFSPPTFPGILPSPHSDQQYFRPVQASPHSPLQQRPHTSGTAGPRYLQHHRNAPSAMGMSMLSSVSTINSDAQTGRTLKKKRSAFGWLKKAFSLDEEERMAFEQRKNEETRNLYYDGRSPKYLDGKRRMK